MESSTATPKEPFVRVRLVRFSDGTQIQPLENLKIRVDTVDVSQSNAEFFILSFTFVFKFLNMIAVTNRPKFLSYDKKMDCFLFMTRTKQNRQVTISVYIDINKTNYTYKTSIEDLIRHADEIIREVMFFKYLSHIFLSLY